MRTVYSTTKPRWSDTKAIVKAKYLQALNDGPTDGTEGQEITYPDTENRFADTSKITWDKILQTVN